MSQNRLTLWFGGVWIGAFLLLQTASPAAAAAPAQDPQTALSALEQRLAEQEARVAAARAALLRASESAGRPKTSPPAEVERTFTAEHAQFVAQLDKVRAMLLRASGVDLAVPQDLHSSVQALRSAERALVDLRSKYFAQVEAHSNAWRPEQLAALVRRGLPEAPPPALPEELTSYFGEPAARDFEDHQGFTVLFDGKTLQDWDGDPAVWQVKEGAIVGTSTWEHPVANSYLSYHGTEAKDFDLKLEIKVAEHAGSGIQYRSVVGVPWRVLLPQMPPTQPRWLMTGPQADFFPEFSVFSGQFYSENTPLGILAWRGQVVNSVPGRKPRLVARIGGRVELGNAIKLNDWNQYEIIARGGVMMHIINGQLMAVQIDDDPASSNNASGLIGIEIELFPGSVSVRNVWLRKLR